MLSIQRPMSYEKALFNIAQQIVQRYQQATQETVFADLICEMEQIRDLYGEEIAYCEVKKRKPFPSEGIKISSYIVWRNNEQGRYSLLDKEGNQIFDLGF